jgi:hypothetical protein
MTKKDWKKEIAILKAELKNGCLSFERQDVEEALMEAKYMVKEQ